MGYLPYQVVSRILSINRSDQEMTFTSTWLHREETCFFSPLLPFQVAMFFVHIQLHAHLIR